MLWNFEFRVYLFFFANKRSHFLILVTCLEIKEKKNQKEREKKPMTLYEITQIPRSRTSHVKWIYLSEEGLNKTFGTKRQREASIGETILQ